MKRLILTFALAIGVAGCLGTFVPSEPTGGGDGADMAHASTGTGGNGSGNGNGTGNGTGGGMNGGGSTDMAQAASPGDGGVVGTKAFGDLCTVNGDCQSGLCEPFAQQTVHRCTKACTIATQTTDCPAPSAGTCTNNGYCKFNN